MFYVFLDVANAPLRLHVVDFQGAPGLSSISIIRHPATIRAVFIKEVKTITNCLRDPERYCKEKSVAFFKFP
jgi:hypothetical protein